MSGAWLKEISNPPKIEMNKNKNGVNIIYACEREARDKDKKNKEKKQLLEERKREPGNNVDAGHCPNILLMFLRKKTKNLR
jgi:hypothetical protein